MRSTETVTAFWEDVWNAHDPDAVDRFVDDDIVVEIGGREVSGRKRFQELDQELAGRCQRTARRRHRDLSERGGHPRYFPVVSDGDEQRHFGGKPDQQPVAKTGISIWKVGKDGKLVRGSIEPSA